MIEKFTAKLTSIAIALAAQTGMNWAATTTVMVDAVTASTIAVVIAAKFMPVWGAKAIAILVSFAVNFSITHFVVFRPKGERADVH